MLKKGRENKVEQGGVLILHIILILKEVDSRIR